MPTLPDFPWDRLAPFAERARQHPDGIVDLSIGTPVDPTPEVVRAALRDAADAPGYPMAYGTPALRDAVAGWFRRRHSIDVDPAAVVPTVGSKELVALLPSLLDLEPGTRVLIPELAYPTYEVGVLLASCEPVRVPLRDGLLDLDAVDPAHAGLLWLNHPANPHGAVATAADMDRIVTWARGHDVLVASDECYLELGWDATPASALVAGAAGVLAIHSLSKRSNLAGYRAGFVAGDPGVVQRLLERRRHMGLLVPAPVQAAMVAALDDDDHVEQQRARYAARRAALRPALERAGWRIDHSEGGLYLWCTDGRDCWAQTQALADSGVLVAPGEFYGVGGARHVRVALTATDERIEAAVKRLEGLS